MTTNMIRSPTGGTLHLERREFVHHRGKDRTDAIPFKSLETMPFEFLSMQISRARLLSSQDRITRIWPIISGVLTEMKGLTQQAAMVRLLQQDLTASQLYTFYTQKAAELYTSRRWMSSFDIEKRVARTKRRIACCSSGALLLRIGSTQSAQATG